MEKHTNIRVIGRVVRCMVQVEVSGTMRRVKYHLDMWESMRMV